MDHGDDEGKSELAEEAEEAEDPFPEISRTETELRSGRKNTSSEMSFQYVSSLSFSCGFYLHICPCFSHGLCLQLLSLKNGRGKMVSPKRRI